jgi:large subunit ribosomal protein L3
MKFILGTKQHMTQVFTEDGVAHPATIVSAGPIVVTQLKNNEKDGYQATQVGYGERRKKNINKAQQGHTKDLGDFRYMREFRTNDDTEQKVGDKINVSTFEVGDTVVVSSISKGKGFQGVVKRHGFHGGPRSHGQKHSEREPGSIGATGPQRVFKGVRMGGRMGSDRVTVKNLQILQIDQEENQLVIRGAIPGRRGTLVEIRSVE